jgi:dipeptidase
MTNLVKDYGYASTGESFSIADQNELWVLELIGKGRKGLGAVWVARKVPEGHVTGHANQARITTFPLNDPENTLYAPDVISFARDLGLYEGEDEDFSFSDVYDPVTFDGARFCEARVWSYFSTIMGQEWSDQYLDYAQGLNLTNRMPLWVKPAAKISPQDVMQGMRNHYEGTALDNSGTQFPDVGAESAALPIRHGSLMWENKDKTYFNERTIAQSPTGWSIVCQSRADVATEMAALMWFGIDDSSTSVHFPVYGSVTKVSQGWAGLGPQDGATPPLMTFSLDSAFYVFNLVANWAYSRWDAIYPDVLARILSKEAVYFDMVKENDPKVAALLASGDKAGAVDLMTSFSTDIGDQLLKDWFTFFGELFVKYRDGFVTTANPKVPVCGCDTASLSYPDKWYDRIVADTGDRYLAPADASTANLKAGKHGHPTTNKRDLRAFN